MSIHQWGDQCSWPAPIHVRLTTGGCLPSTQGACPMGARHRLWPAPSSYFSPLLTSLSSRFIPLPAKSTTLFSMPGCILLMFLRFQLGFMTFLPTFLVHKSCMFSMSCHIAASLSFWFYHKTTYSATAYPSYSRPYYQCRPKSVLLSLYHLSGKKADAAISLIPVYFLSRTRVSVLSQGINTLGMVAQIVRTNPRITLERLLNSSCSFHSDLLASSPWIGQCMSIYLPHYANDVHSAFLLTKLLLIYEFISYLNMAKPYINISNISIRIHEPQRQNEHKWAFQN